MGRLRPLWVPRSVSGSASTTTGTVDDSTLTWTGFSVNPDVDWEYEINGNVVTLWVLTTGASLTGTSSTIGFSVSGFPTAIRPSQSRSWFTGMTDNGVSILGRASMGSAGAITFAVCTVAVLGSVTISVTGWTASGNKGLPSTFQMQYPLAD